MRPTPWTTWLSEPHRDRPPLIPELKVHPFTLGEHLQTAWANSETSIQLMAKTSRVNCGRTNLTTHWRSIPL